MPKQGRETKYVLVSGGVVSGIGKGMIATSIGVLLKSCGWRVTAVKCDPTLSMDASVESERDEAFVTDDGACLSADMGDYERFLSVEMQNDNYITMGKAYDNVTRKERDGDFLGKTVQVVPHVTNEIIRMVSRGQINRNPLGTTPMTKGDPRSSESVLATGCTKDEFEELDKAGLAAAEAKKAAWIQAQAEAGPGLKDPATGEPYDVVIIELGGTIGDMECMPFTEALRQLRDAVGKENFLSVFVAYIPTIAGMEGEVLQKTKPTQHGLKELMRVGLFPDIVVCRSDEPLSEKARRSIASFSSVPTERITTLSDVSNIYRVPQLLHEQGLCNLIHKQMEMEFKLPTRLANWEEFAKQAECLKEAEVHPAPGTIAGAAEGRFMSISPRASPTPGTSGHQIIAVVTSKDSGNVGVAHHSVIKALKHAGIALQMSIEVRGVSAELLAPSDMVVEDLRQQRVAVEPERESAAPTEEELHALHTNEADEDEDEDGVGGGYTGQGPSTPKKPMSPKAGGGGGSSMTSKPLSPSVTKRRLAAAAEEWRKLREADAILIPSGNGVLVSQLDGSALYGRLEAMKHARENGTPLLAVGDGMQLVVLDARIASEDETGDPADAAKALAMDVPDSPRAGEPPLTTGFQDFNQTARSNQAAVARKGTKSCTLTPRIESFEASTVQQLMMMCTSVSERFWQVNEVCESSVKGVAGIESVSRLSDDERSDPATIIVERTDHEFCIGAAFRPEFTSKPGAPAPLFLGLLLAAREEGRSGMGIRKYLAETDADVIGELMESEHGPWELED